MRKTDLFRRGAAASAVPYRRRGFLATTDAMEFAKALRDNVADIVFVDPPFNLGKDYGHASSLENQSAVGYEIYMKRLLVELVRCMKPGGALFLYHIPYWASILAADLNERLEFRHWIAIAMKNGFARGEKLYPAHYALLYYTKGKPRHFKRPRIGVRRCRHCNEILKDYGGYAQYVRRGINLSDFWEDVSPVRHRSKKLRKANQLPIAITDRVVEIAGVRHGLLIDPFMGSGTSLVSALKKDMHFAGNDLYRGNLSVCHKRLAETTAR